MSIRVSNVDVYKEDISKSRQGAVRNQWRRKNEANHWQRFICQDNFFSSNNRPNNCTVNALFLSFKPKLKEHMWSGENSVGNIWKALTEGLRLHQNIRGERSCGEEQWMDMNSALHCTCIPGAEGQLPDRPPPSKAACLNDCFKFFFDDSTMNIFF